MVKTSEHVSGAKVENWASGNPAQREPLSMSMSERYCHKVLPLSARSTKPQRSCSVPLPSSYPPVLDHLSVSRLVGRGSTACRVPLKAHLLASALSICPRFRFRSPYHLVNEKGEREP